MEAVIREKQRALVSGTMLFMMGTALGMRLELYLQQTGVTATQCEVKAVSQIDFEMIPDIREKETKEVKETKKK